MKNPLVYIIVLCQNSARWLDKCISTLARTRYDNFRIILVDNCSTDGSVDKIKNVYPEVIIIKNDRNYGWCRGNNIGIKLALENYAEFIVLLNSDIKVDQEDWLFQLIEFAQKKPKYSIYGCVQYEYDSDGWAELNSWTKYILSNGNKEVFYMWDSEFRETHNTKVYSEEDIGKNDFLDCYFVQGAAMMIKSKLFYKIGLFDEIYFIFYDEVDFCRRARCLGYKTALVTKSKVKHFGSGDNSTNRRTQNRRNFYFSRNKYIFLMTDVERDFLSIIKISAKLLKQDVIEAFTKKNDISNLLQLLRILFSLAAKASGILSKRHDLKRILKYSNSKI